MSDIDVFPVGLFRDMKHRKFRSGLRYLRGRIRDRNWRAVGNYFNGFLAEHPTLGTRCGHGWTKRHALADLHRHLRELP